MVQTCLFATLSAGRIHDLRISVTDRCNFRCTYCMPREVYGRDYAFLPRAELLTFEEITRLARLFVALGVRKVRLTGGEPLLRRELRGLVAMLAAIDGVDDITLTTNGSLLERQAQALADAGLRASPSAWIRSTSNVRAHERCRFPCAPCSTASTPRPRPG